MKSRIGWRDRIGISMVFTLALAGAAGCSGGGSSTTGPSGTGRVQGTLTQAPGASVATAREYPGRLVRLLSSLTSPLLGTAEAALPPGDPVGNAVVRLECSGGVVMTTRTSASGRFEFEGVPGGTCSIFVVLNGTPVAIARDIRVGSGPVEIEGRISSVGGQPGLRRFEVESDVDDDDGAGHPRHHSERHHHTEGHDKDDD